MNTIHQKVRVAIAATTFIIGGLLLSACGGNADANDPAAKDDKKCVPAEPKITEKTPTVAILGATGEGLAEFEQDIEMVIDSAAEDEAHVIVSAVGDGESPSLLSNVVLTSEGNNDLERTSDLNCKAENVAAALVTLKTTDAAARPNPLAAIKTLAGNLDNDASDEPVDVVLLTPLSTAAGGVDLADSKTLSDPVAAINTLAEQGLIPTCTGFRFYGVSPDSEVGDVDAAALRDFWLMYAEKCGGTFVAWTDHLTSFPLTEPVTATDRSQIEVEKTPEAITATLGADVIFGADSAELRKAARPALEELLGLTAEYAGDIVITGYVNPVNPGTNSEGDKSLSKARADAVGNWLVDNGVDRLRITTIGKGTADAVFPNPTTDDERAANRRVVAVIHAKAE